MRFRARAPAPSPGRSPNKVATADAQLIGSYNPSAGSWLWAWANEPKLDVDEGDGHLVPDHQLRQVAR